MKIAIINGPNLNLLGTREPGIYGEKKFEDYLKFLQEKFTSIDFFYFQSNIEGEIINYLQFIAPQIDGVILNPAGYTHTSVAIGDAIIGLNIKLIEVHISNIYSREEFRKISHISAKAIGIISGLGLDGYELAVHWFYQNIK